MKGIMKVERIARKGRGDEGKGGMKSTPRNPVISMT